MIPTTRPISCIMIFKVEKRYADGADDYDLLWLGFGVLGFGVCFNDALHLYVITILRVRKGTLMELMVMICYDLPNSDDHNQS